MDPFVKRTDWLGRRLCQWLEPERQCQNVGVITKVYGFTRELRCRECWVKSHTHPTEGFCDPHGGFEE